MLVETEKGLAMLEKILPVLLRLNLHISSPRFQLPSIYLSKTKGSVYLQDPWKMLIAGVFVSIAALTNGAILPGLKQHKPVKVLWSEEQRHCS